MAEEIILIKGYPDGTLELSDKGHTKAKKGKEIKWKIKDGSDAASIKVAFIELIEIKEDPSNIISIPYKEGNKWKAEIDKHAPPGAECKYSIHWKDPNGNEREHDPKISVLPSTFDFTKLFVALSLGLLALLSLGFLSRKQSKK